MTNATTSDIKQAFFSLLKARAGFFRPIPGKKNGTHFGDEHLVVGHKREIV